MTACERECLVPVRHALEQPLLHGSWTVKLDGQLPRHAHKVKHDVEPATGVAARSLIRDSVEAVIADAHAWRPTGVSPGAAQNSDLLLTSEGGLHRESLGRDVGEVLVGVVVGIAARIPDRMTVVGVQIGVRAYSELLARCSKGAKRENLCEHVLT